MRLALPRLEDTTEANQTLSQWMLLPSLCCQAAGGESRWAEDITAAWFLFYIGAHIMDSVEDEDEPDDWWEEVGPGVAVNIASGLYFSASLSLQYFYTQQNINKLASEIIEDFNRSLLSMCAGQHRDLLPDVPKLKQFWETAAAKSGSFFSLACRSGARLGTDDLTRVDHYGKFGHNLGVLIQILDELEDIKDSQNADGQPNRADIRKSLPVLYALEVLSQEERQRLESCLHGRDSEKYEVEEILNIIDNCGAALYILAEIERYRLGAEEALSLAEPESPAGEILLANIQSLGRL